MEIVYENADFSGKTDFGNTFCENGNSIKWKFGQEFSIQTFKNGIPFYRESAVDWQIAVGARVGAGVVGAILGAYVGCLVSKHIIVTLTIALG